MGEAPDSRFRRGDVEGKARRDLERRRGRAGEGGFWRSMGLMGSVGWPIVALGIGGALLGLWLDGRWRTGVHLTLVLLTVGTALGSWMAFRAVRGSG